MAACTIDQSVLAHQWETSVGVNLFGIEDFPSLRVMTSLTVVTHFRLVHILMTGRTVGAYHRKVFYIVTRFAIDFAMTVFETEFRLAVVIADLVPGD